MPKPPEKADDDPAATAPVVGAEDTPKASKSADNSAKELPAALFLDGVPPAATTRRMPARATVVCFI